MAVLRSILVALLFALLAGADGAPQSLPDIAGTAAAVPICSSCGIAKWVQIVAPSGNVSNARWGDANISASRGAIIAPAGGMYMAPFQICPCNLGSIYVYVANGDSVTVTFGY